jgi:uncharacterized protein (TIGR02646 family)
MRRIFKNQRPAVLDDFVAMQLAIEPVPVNLTYGSLTNKANLLQHLTEEQYGLCGYTGAPVDERISGLKSENGKATFTNHIEHLKPQSVCRQEVEAQGYEYGRVLADDLSYENMIAAVEVTGAKSEHFGAVLKANRLLPLLPTHEGCEKQFQFSEVDGRVIGMSREADEAISILGLNHKTLANARLYALSSWFSADVIDSLDSVKDLMREVSTPKNGQLVEYAFVIEAVARMYINEDDL